MGKSSSTLDPGQSSPGRVLWAEEMRVGFRDSTIGVSGRQSQAGQVVLQSPNLQVR